MAGVSEPTIRVIETARRESYNQGTLRSIAQALGWTPDSIDRIYDSLEPIVAGSADAYEDSSVEARISELELRLAQMQATLDAIAPWRDLEPDLSDPDEAAIWAKEALSLMERREAIWYLRVEKVKAAERATTSNDDNDDQLAS